MNKMNRRKRMKRGKRGGFPAVVLFLTLITVFCSVGTAMSRSDLSIQELEGYYHEKEKVLVEEARELLEARGFANSGVMLTRMVDGDGRREYTLTVHHGKIGRLHEEEQAALMAELEKIVFEDEGSVFSHRFLYE